MRDFLVTVLVFIVLVALFGCEDQAKDLGSNFAKVQSAFMEGYNEGEK